MKCCEKWNYNNSLWGKSIDKMHFNYCPECGNSLERLEEKHTIGECPECHGMNAHKSYCSYPKPKSEWCSCITQTSGICHKCNKPIWESDKGSASREKAPPKSVGKCRKSHHSPIKSSKEKIKQLEWDSITQDNLLEIIIKLVDKQYEVIERINET